MCLKIRCNGAKRKFLGTKQGLKRKKEKKRLIGGPCISATSSLTFGVLEPNIEQEWNCPINKHEIEFLHP
jgi:hypothetical protein